MKNIFRLFSWLLLCLTAWLITGLTAHAQLEQDTTDIRHQPVPRFKNVNRTAYYTDQKKLQQIKELEKKEDWAKLHKALKSYVSNFGIQNFYKDTYYLWRLAKLSELLGTQEEAKMYYRLALKHHRSDIDLQTIELHYNELNKNTADLYVPLEYYYELVDYRRQVDTLMPPRSVLLNMGEDVNSKTEDYGPALNLQNNLLVLTSKRNVQRRGLEKAVNEDLYFSELRDGVWSTAESFRGINTQYNEGSATISRDGKTIIFSRCDSPDSYGSCDLFVARQQADGSWGGVRNLGINVNSVSWDSHPSLSQTEDTLFFASDRIGGFGMGDIWYAVKGKGGEWSPAKNAGPVVNTRNNEVSPFVHPRYNILYFSSNGHILNFGEFDIYKSYWSANGWGEPVNIGPLVNGKGSEFYFTIDSESRNLYYAASKQDKMANLDLYSFPLPMGAQPLATTKFKGSLLNEENGTPFKGIVSVIDLDKGVEIEPKFLREDGSFEFDLIRDRNYLLVMQGDDFFRIEEMFYLDGDTEIERRTQSISQKLEFTTIDFPSGSSTVTPEMYPDLNKLANFLIDHPDVKLVISGHTDSDGNEELNKQLSEKRALSILEYLVHFASVHQDQVQAIGYGSSKPIVLEEKTEEDKKLNRRVEFELIRPGQEEAKK